jgi:purine-nucleoside phosphorylase
MNLELLKDSLSEVKDHFIDHSPALTIVLGSGWSDVVSSLNILQSIDYSDIPVMGQSQVKGHTGKLLLLEHGGKEIVVFQGRHHWYEGCGWDAIAFPIFLTKELAIKSILLTNAAGSLSKSVKPGDLMIIDDHINAMSNNPLIGKHDPYWGPHFPDQSEVYDPKLRDILDSACKDSDATYHHGVYIAKDGPTYETPAEVQSLQAMGGTAVGMSTVPEAILANSIGLTVAGLSCITNLAAGVGNAKLTHEEVLSETTKAMPIITSIIEKTLLAI